MGKQLLCRWSLIRINCQAQFDELTEAIGPTRSDLGRVPRNNVDHDAALGLTDIGRISLGKFVCEDTEGPDVDFGVVSAFSLDELRSHPAQSADLG